MITSGGDFVKVLDQSDEGSCHWLTGERGSDCGHSISPPSPRQKQTIRLFGFQRRLSHQRLAQSGTSLPS